MNASLIERYKEIIIQIATPFSTGTGFYLKEYNLIITNEHIIRDNREAIIEGLRLEKQLARVLFADTKYDLAFLEISDQPTLANVSLSATDSHTHNTSIWALGYPFGSVFKVQEGSISNVSFQQNGLNYLQHNVALEPGYSGGPLVNEAGEIIGVNTFLIIDGENTGFSLPVSYLVANISAYLQNQRAIGVRCDTCATLAWQDSNSEQLCLTCQMPLYFPSQAAIYEATGTAHTIEQIITQSGYDIRLSRRGPNNWEIHQGSAHINISYYEKNGLITGDAYLCLLPESPSQDLCQFLLKQNYEMEGLTFSTKGKDIILSFLIYDQYLNAETGVILFKHLFEKADYYDNILVDQYGAIWKNALAE